MELLETVAIKNTPMDIQLNEKVLDLIHSSIISEGGDGDAIWLSKYTNLAELKKQVEAYNENKGIGWNIIDSDKYFVWGKDQECAIFTDDEEYYESQFWIVLKLDY